ncbi:Yip1 family protein [Ignavibacterium sp.]|uniref:Yip1 family protein n=1 Tax=Ignavibacterium sp. TaxID=2651167 RepID=UPI00307E2AC7
MNIFERVKNILVSPKSEWEVIKNEQSTVADLFTKYALILALIPVVAGFIGQSLIGISLGPFGSFKVPIINGLIYAVLYYILTLAGIYLVAFVVDALAPSFGAEKDMVSSLKVVVYSYTAVWVAGIFQIIPALAILGIVGLYSLYLLYLGLNIVKGSPSDKVVGYTVVVVVITIVVYFIIGAIVGSIALGGLMMSGMKGF